MEKNCTPPRQSHYDASPLTSDDSWLRTVVLAGGVALQLQCVVLIIDCHPKS